MSFIQKLDQFGVVFNLGTSHSQNKYKSRIGGICSLTIYLAALLYFFFVMWKWLIDRQMLPKITQSTQFIDYQEISLEENVITFKLVRPQKKDPFDPNRNIIFPKMIEQKNGEMNFIPLKDNLKKDPDNISSLFEFKNYTLSYNGGMSNKTLITYIIIFAICEPSKSQTGIQCAPQDEIDAFFKQLNILQVSITLNQFNVNTRKMDKFTKQYYPLLDGTNTPYQQLILKTGEAQKFEGFLIAEQQNQQYLYSSDLITQTLSQKYFEDIFNLKLCQSFFISIDSLKQIQAIQYQLLGEVLPQVSSILSILMLIGIAIRIINSSQLEQYLTDEIIGFYYPQYKKLKVNRNFFNKITSLKSKDEKIEYRIDKFEKVYENARKTANTKLNILNIIYEISRIQFVLQSLQQNEYILRSHNVGIKLELQQKLKIGQVKNQQNEGEEMIKDGSIQQQQDYRILNDEDMKLLSFDKKITDQHGKEQIEQQHYNKQQQFYKENDVDGNV